MLRDNDMTKSQNYYGIAMRRCAASSIYQLKKTVGAVLYNGSGADTVEQ